MGQHNKNIYLVSKMFICINLHKNIGIIRKNQFTIYFPRFALKNIHIQEHLQFFKAIFQSD